MIVLELVFGPKQALKDRTIYDTFDVNNCNEDCVPLSNSIVQNVPFPTLRNHGYL